MVDPLDSPALVGMAFLTLVITLPTLHMSWWGPPSAALCEQFFGSSGLFLFEKDGSSLELFHFISFPSQISLAFSTARFPIVFEHVSLLMLGIPSSKFCFNVVHILLLFLQQNE